MTTTTVATDSIAPTKRRKSLTSEVIAVLRKSIENGKWKPGVKLPTEQELATQFEVSRTVVREAVSALKADGLIQTRHGVGAFVIEQGEMPHFKVNMDRLTSIENVINLLELRIALETDMAGFAAERRTSANLKSINSYLEKINELMKEGKDTEEADFAFHLAIAKATQNDYFVDFVRFMGTKTVPARNLIVKPSETSDYVTLINAEHSAITQAIADKDVERARLAARSHLLNSKIRHAEAGGMDLRRR